MTKKHNTIPVVLASSAEYAPYMYVTIQSLLENKNIDTKYDIYCLVNNGFHNKLQSKFYSLKTKYDNVNIKFINMKDAFATNKTSAHITTPTFYRLKIPEILKKYSKVIYLDTDIIVTKDLTEFYNIDIEGYYIAGVKAAAYMMKPETKKRYEPYGLDTLDNYINAGVTLWNLNKIREDNKLSLLYDLSKENFKSMDQDVINVAFYKNIKILELKYNLMTKYPDLTGSGPKYDKYVQIYGEQNIKEALENPVIIHYADSFKPWNSKKVWLEKYWWKYAKMTPFYLKFWFRRNIFSVNRIRDRKIILILGIVIKIKNMEK